MADVVYASDFRNGITFEYENSVYTIKKFQHVKPGKGAAFVRATIRDVKNGGVIERTFRPEEKFNTAMIERKDMQYLYNYDGTFYFMDEATGDQIELSEEQLDGALKFVKENEFVTILSHNGSVFGVEAPNFVELEIVHTEPGARGNTATNVMKPATVETGAEIDVPLFIEIGDKIKIDTRTEEYLGRAK